MLDKYLDVTIEAMLYEIRSPGGRKFDSLETALEYLAQVFNSIGRCFGFAKTDRQFFTIAIPLVNTIESPSRFLVYAIAFLFARRCDDQFSCLPRESLVVLLNSIKFDPHMLKESFRDETEFVFSTFF